MSHVPFEFRLAWREIRPALRRFAFMAAAVALGVGSVTGIKGFGTALDSAIARSGRDLVAADLSVRLNSMPEADSLEVLESLRGMGAQLTRATETLTMAGAGNQGAPLLSTIKAVDPREYPFYGTVELEGATPFARALTDDAAVVTRELLTRTGTAVGDELRIGSAKFRIAAVLKSEPDRLVSGFDLGPRILVTRKGLEQARLIQFGSRLSETFLYKLPPGFTLERARELITKGLNRRVRISDYRNPNPSVTRGLERMGNYLTLIGLLALLVGGIGVASSIHTYLQQKYDSIAIVKSIGGRSSQIVRIYLIQGLCLGVVGSVAGVALGYLVQMAFPTLVRGIIDLPTEVEPAPGAAFQGLVIGITTTLLFLLPPLLAVRNVKPARIFLRDLPDPQRSAAGRLRRSAAPLTAALILLAGIAAAASWLADSLVRGLWFVAGLAGAIVVLALAARVLLSVLRRIPRPSSLALRYGLRNLDRPGSHVTAVLVSLGVGVGFVLTVYLIQSSLIGQIVKSAPADFPNFFMIGITREDKDSVWEFLRGRRGIVDAGQPIPTVPSRLRTVDGKTADQMGLTGSERRFFEFEFMLTWSEDIPPDSRIVEGSWWRGPSPEPQISAGQNAARLLGLRIGSVLAFESSGRMVRGRVTNIRDVEFSRPGTSNQFIFSPGVLETLPAFYVGALRVDPRTVADLQGRLFRRFPGITTVDVGQVLTRIQGILDRIATVIRFIAVFAIFAGIIILASSVASTRYQRIRESVLLKTLGATRAQVARIQATEFLAIGLAAGLIGALLASAAAYFLLGYLLDAEFRFRWAPVLVSTVATAALAVATGWLASRGVLAHRPLEILREN